MKRLTTLIIAFALAISVSAPAAFADKGGVHSTKPCPAKSQSKKPKKERKNDKGKKCGQRAPAPAPGPVPEPPVEEPAA